MTCEAVHSESGFLCYIKGCPEYIKLLSEKSRLEGLCAGLEEGNARNQEAMKRQDARMLELLTEIQVVRQENVELSARLHEHDYVIQHVTEDGSTTRSYVSSDGGWAMIHKDRLAELEEAEEKCRRLAAIVEKADALAARAEMLLADDSTANRCAVSNLIDAYRSARNG